MQKWLRDRSGTLRDIKTGASQRHGRLMRTLCVGQQKERLWTASGRVWRSVQEGPGACRLQLDSAHGTCRGLDSAGRGLVGRAGSHNRHPRAV